MDATAYIEKLSARVPGAAYEAAPSVDFATIYVPAAILVDTCRVLRDTPELAFSVLIEVTCADYFPREPRFEVVYHLLSMTNRLRLRLKVRVGDGQALPTVQGLWPGANWPEREVYDMFGVFFEGHDDLRRILMPEDWEGYPQRKDFPVQVKKAVQTYEPLEISEEEFRANLERDRQRRSRGV